MPGENKVNIQSETKQCLSVEGETIDGMVWAPRSTQGIRVVGIKWVNKCG